MRAGWVQKVHTSTSGCSGTVSSGLAARAAAVTLDHCCSAVCSRVRGLGELRRDANFRPRGIGLLAVQPLSAA